MVVLRLIYNLILYSFWKPLSIITSIIVEVKEIVSEMKTMKTSRKEEDTDGNSKRN